MLLVVERIPSQFLLNFSVLLPLVILRKKKSNYQTVYASEIKMITVSNRIGNIDYDMHT